MELTKEQSDYLLRYCQNNQVYNHHEVASIVAVSEAMGDVVVINADWWRNNMDIYIAMEELT